MPVSNKLPRETRDKLIVALQMDEIVSALNIVSRARGLRWHLDYTNPLPKLKLSQPGGEPQAWMTVNPQRQHCLVHLLPTTELRLAVNDLQDRLRRAQARLALTTQKRRDGRKECRLQVYVDGASTIALTLLTARKSQHVTDTHFEVPGAIKQ